MYVEQYGNYMSQKTTTNTKYVNNDATKEKMKGTTVVLYESYQRTPGYGFTDGLTAHEKHGSRTSSGAFHLLCK